MHHANVAALMAAGQGVPPTHHSTTDYVNVNGHNGWHQYPATMADLYSMKQPSVQQYSDYHMLMSNFAAQAPLNNEPIKNGGHSPNNNTNFVATSASVVHKDTMNGHCPSLDTRCKPEVVGRSPPVVVVTAHDSPACNSSPSSTLSYASTGPCKSPVPALLPVSSAQHCTVLHSPSTGPTAPSVITTPSSSASSLSISAYYHPSKDTTFTKIFVGGLPYHTTDKSLRAFFESYGDIEEAVVITDRQTGKSRGYGFVSNHHRHQQSLHAPEVATTKYNQFLI